MKRSAPLERDPEKIRAWEERSRERARGREGMRSTELRRSETPAPAPARREKPSARRRRARDERPKIWHRGIMGTICKVCGKRPAMDAHHILREQVLRREAHHRGYDFEDVRFDSRNRLGVCRQCHQDHHSGKKRIPRDVLERYARWVFDFAKRYDLEHVLDREYPDTNPKGAPA